MPKSFSTMAEATPFITGRLDELDRQPLRRRRWAQRAIDCVQVLSWQAVICLDVAPCPKRRLRGAPVPLLCLTENGLFGFEARKYLLNGEDASARIART